MKTFIKTLLLLVIVINIGCDKDDEPVEINASDKLIGHWINPVVIDSELKFERSNSLKKNDYGISFLIESMYIERSSGWCGTPPLVYADFKGLWKRNDGMITITIDNGMNGVQDINYEIKSLDDRYLVMKQLHEN